MQCCKIPKQVKKFVLYFRECDRCRAGPVTYLRAECDHALLLSFQTGSLQVLSQQMLVDCSWGFGNNGCDGGEEWRAYEWIMKHGGIATMETYGAYMGMVR